MKWRQQQKGRKEEEVDGRVEWTECNSRGGLKCTARSRHTSISRIGATQHLPACPALTPHSLPAAPEAKETTSARTISNREDKKKLGE